MKTCADLDEILEIEFDTAWAGKIQARALARVQAAGLDADTVTLLEQVADLLGRACTRSSRVIKRIRGRESKARRRIKA